MNLVGGWNQLISVIPSGLLTAATVIGVGIIIVFIAIWVWQGRRGGGVSMKSFPWMAIIFGGLLAGPQLIVPAILLLLQALLTIFITLLTWFAGLF